jgi:hypothetical protein
MDRRYGKRMARYWTAREASALQALAGLDMSGWFNWWHMHPDWKAKGDRCAENRVVSLQILYRLLRAAEDLAGKASKPIQCWAFVGSSAYDDAVYMHSENPRGTPPYDFAGVEWGHADHPLLEDIVDSSTHRIGNLANDSGVMFVICARNL